MNNSATTKKLLILLVLRFCLSSFLILIGFFALEPLRSTLFRITFGAFLLAGLLLILLAADRLLDWETTPLLLANVLILVAVVVPQIAENLYVLGFGFSLIVASGIAPWIARKVKR